MTFFRKQYKPAISFWLVLACLIFSIRADCQVASIDQHDFTVVLTQMADFQVTTTPDPGNVNITLLNLNQDINYTDGKYSVAHTSPNEKKILAQVTGGSAAFGITLRAYLEAPAAGAAETKGSVELLDGGVSPLAAQTLVEKVPPGFFEDLALHYSARANVSATVGANVFTVTFTVSE